MIVDAKKPQFFEGGSMLREVDDDTLSLKLGVFTGSLQKGKVYSGGILLVILALNTVIGWRDVNRESSLIHENCPSKSPPLFTFIAFDLCTWVL